MGIFILFRRANEGDIDGEEVDRGTFSKKYTDKFLNDFELPYTVKLYGFYFEKAMIKDAKLLMDINMNNPTVWERLTTNEGQAEPKALSFTIDAPSKKFLDTLATDSLNYLFGLGEFFLEARCEGMQALIGQYLADALTVGRATGVDPYEEYKRKCNLLGIPP
jgi:hypothetical protein